MQINLKAATDEDLKRRAVELLAQGVIPYEQWSSVFVDPELSMWPGLQAKAFSVWFPTMIDYLSGRAESTAIKNELCDRKVDCEQVFELSEELERCFIEVLSLYTNKEQIFIRDRRLQNVHGRLHINLFEKHEIKVFNKTSKKTESIKLTAHEYRKIMDDFYGDLSKHSSELIQRLLESQPFNDLTELHINRLKVEDYLKPLIEKLGVSAAAGNG